MLLVPLRQVKKKRRKLDLQLVPSPPSPRSKDKTDHTNVTSKDIPGILIFIYLIKFFKNSISEIVNDEEKNEKTVDYEQELLEENADKALEILRLDIWEEHLPKLFGPNGVPVQILGLIFNLNPRNY